MNLLIATGNQGKVLEFRQMLGGDNAYTWSDLSEHRDVPTPEETGKTFRANACLKAAYYATRLNTWALADDSGIQIDALNGAPGVLSAPWAEINGAGHGDAANNELVLRQLGQVPDEKRTARFVCVLALSDPSGNVIFTAADSVEGRMLRAPRGTNGFGYDPLFLVDSLGKSTAELQPDEKHRISHRGKALVRLRQLMQNLPAAKV